MAVVPACQERPGSRNGTSRRIRPLLTSSAQDTNIRDRRLLNIIRTSRRRPDRRARVHIGVGHRGVGLDQQVERAGAAAPPEQRRRLTPRRGVSGTRPHPQAKLLGESRSCGCGCPADHCAHVPRTTAWAARRSSSASRVARHPDGPARPARHRRHVQAWGAVRSSATRATRSIRTGRGPSRHDIEHLARSGSGGSTGEGCPNPPTVDGECGERPDNRCGPGSRRTEHPEPVRLHVPAQACLREPSAGVHRRPRAPPRLRRRAARRSLIDRAVDHRAPISGVAARTKDSGGSCARTTTRRRPPSAAPAATQRRTEDICSRPSV